MVVAKKVTNKKKKSKPVNEDNDLSLPGIDELNEPPKSFLEYCTVIYGTKGIGKTTLCSSLSEKALVLMLEPRRRNLNIRMKQLRPVSVSQIENGELDCWQYFKDLVELCQQDDSVDLIVIDTIDKLYEACLNSVCAREGIEHPGGLNDFGAAWSAVKMEFTTFLDSILYESSLGVIFTSHAKETDIEINTEKATRYYGPSCSGAAEAYLKAAADFAFFYGRHGEDRALHFRWNQSIWTACGVADRFLAPDGRKLAAIKIPDPKNGPTGQYLLSAFENAPTSKVLVYDDAEEEEEEETVAKPKKKMKRKVS